MYFKAQLSRFFSFRMYLNSYSLLPLESIVLKTRFPKLFLVVRGKATAKMLKMSMLAVTLIAGDPVRNYARLCKVRYTFERSASIVMLRIQVINQDDKLFSRRRFVESR